MEFMTTRSLLKIVASSTFILAAGLAPTAIPRFMSSELAIAQSVRPVNQIAQTTSQVAALEQAVHTQINQHRRSKGLSPLTFDARIAQQSRTHSQAMASGKVPFSHNGFQQRVQAISIPFRAVAENVAYNLGHSDPAKVAVQNWLKSSGHRQNIEGNFNLTGVGVARNAKGEVYFTQIFLRQR
jgi:uncharacterized protein YkwD